MSFRDPPLEQCDPLVRPRTAVYRRRHGRILVPHTVQDLVGITLDPFLRAEIHSEAIHVLDVERAKQRLDVEGIAGRAIHRASLRLEVGARSRRGCFD